MSDREQQLRHSYALGKIIIFALLGFLAAVIGIDMYQWSAKLDSTTSTILDCTTSSGKCYQTKTLDTDFVNDSTSLTAAVYCTKTLPDTVTVMEAYHCVANNIAIIRTAKK